MTDKQQAIFDLIVELKERFERTRTELADLNRWIQEEAPRIAVEESRKVLERAEKAEAENAQLREALRDLLKELHDGVTPLLHRGKPGAFDICIQRIARARKALLPEANSISPGDGTLRIKKGS